MRDGAQVHVQYVSNGVRPGGIGSPVLLNLYTDDMCSRQLNQCRSGCMVEELVNHLVYPDESVILSPSSVGL